jgi:hypothetical protein
MCMIPQRPCGAATDQSPPIEAGALPALSSRRSVVRSIGLMVVAGLPAWIPGTQPPRDVIVVDGWILADSDLR